MDWKRTGEQCAKFRKEVLQITLAELCRTADANVKNVSAFENGRANNIKYLFYYLACCDTDDEKRVFAHYVFEGA